MEEISGDNANSTTDAPRKRGRPRKIVEPSSAIEATDRPAKVTIEVLGTCFISESRKLFANRVYEIDEADARLLHDKGLARLTWPGTKAKLSTPRSPATIALMSQDNPDNQELLNGNVV